LHTGDFRFHKNFFTLYPELYPKVEEQDQRAIDIDLLILDCTFGNPYEEFPPQDKAFEQIFDIADEVVKN